MMPDFLVSFLLLVIDKDSYRDELPFLWSLANSSVVLYYYTTSFVHEFGADAFSDEKVIGQLYFLK